MQRAEIGFVLFPSRQICSFPPLIAYERAWASPPLIWRKRKRGEGKEATTLRVKGINTSVSGFNFVELPLSYSLKLRLLLSILDPVAFVSAHAYFTQTAAYNL